MYALPFSGLRPFCHACFNAVALCWALFARPPVGRPRGCRQRCVFACGVTTQMASAAQVCMARKLTAIAVSRTIGYGSTTWPPQQGRTLAPTCRFAARCHMVQAHTRVSHDYAGCSEEEKTKVLEAFDNFGAPLLPKAKPAAPLALPTILPALLSGPNQGSSSSGSSSSSSSTTNASSTTSASSSASSSSSAPSGTSDYVPSESMSHGPAACRVTRSQAARPKKCARPKSTGKRARDEWEDDSDA